MSLFNLMLYLFQEDWKQSEGYKVGLLNYELSIKLKKLICTIFYTYTFSNCAGGLTTLVLFVLIFTTFNLNVGFVNPGYK